MIQPDFAKRGGLVPAVVQDATTLAVLMLAWVNQEAWIKTQETGKATFWSTSRHELWQKGATSGDWLTVVEIRIDCDEDSILYLVHPEGDGVCHTKNSLGRSRTSCFYRRVNPNGSTTVLEP